jgi:hypothetical protein
MLFGEMAALVRTYSNALDINAFKNAFVLSLEADSVLGASNFKEAIRLDYDDNFQKYLHTSYDLLLVLYILNVKCFTFQHPTYLMFII